MRVLSYRQLKTDKGIPYSRVHLGRLERAGRFPRRLRVGENRVGWLEIEIDEYISLRAQARDLEPTGPAPAAA